MTNYNRYDKLIKNLISQNYLASPRIIDAFKQTPRVDYIPDVHKKISAINAPLPLTDKQTTSQPLTIAFMLELLQPQPGDKILEIGYGSGWQTAILAKIVYPPDSNLPNNKKSGEVYACEIIPSVAKFGNSNLNRNIPTKLRSRIHLSQVDYRESFKENAPYDRIIAGAAFENVPTDLIKSLTINGTFVFPTKARDIRRIQRTGKTQIIEETFPGFIFVPITHKNPGLC